MALSKGETVGQYQILDRVGQGGMATVYRAYHKRLDRQVAIKFIHQSFMQDRNFIGRFEREARIIANLEHPNIMPIYDFAEHNGQPFLVMKLIDGITLKDLLYDGSLPLEDILEVGRPIAEAIDYAHSEGVLHRDIKPSNIMLDMKGVPYLTDFGLARLATSGESTMSQDMIIGTPFYMSPEQGEGKKVLDSRSDLYSFGVVIYELVMGKVPFSQGTPYSIIHDHIYEPLTPPRKLNPNLPITVEQFLLRALAKDPDDRYQTAKEMMQELEKAAGNGNFVDGHGRDIINLEDSLSRLRRDLALLNKDEVIPAVADPPPAPEPQQATPPPSPTAAKPRRKQSPSLAVVLFAGLLATILGCGLGLLLIPDAREQIMGLVTDDDTEPVIPTLASAGNSEDNDDEGGEDDDDDAQPDFPPAAPPAPGDVPPPSEDGGRGRPPQSPQSEDVELYDVPELGVEEAEAAVEDNPEDPINYLALALALAEERDDGDEALRALQQGLEVAADDPVFYLTAAATADDNDAVDLATWLYVEALDNFPRDQAVRAASGEYLYELTTDRTNFAPRTLRGQREVRDVLPTNIHPIVDAMRTQVFITHDIRILAQQSIRSVAEQDPVPGEVHLVLGDLNELNDYEEGARSEWQLAQRDPLAPEWVRDIADEKLAELE